MDHFDPTDQQAEGHVSSQEWAGTSLIERYYDEEAHIEWQRLERHRTEFAVTMRALKDYLPSAPQAILDFGTVYGEAPTVSC